MLVIRLMRTGKTHSPHYRVVVQEKRSKLTGKSVDQIGHYHPADATKLFVIDKDKARKWLAAGAQPSDTIANLLVREGILDKSRAVKHFYTPEPKEEVAAPAATAAEEVKEAAQEVVSEEPEAAEFAPETTPEEVPAEAAPEETTTEEAPAA